MSHEDEAINARTTVKNGIPLRGHKNGEALAQMRLALPQAGLGIRLANKVLTPRTRSLNRLLDPCSMLRRILFHISCEKRQTKVIHSGDSILRKVFIAVTSPALVNSQCDYVTPMGFCCQGVSHNANV